MPIVRATVADVPWIGDLVRPTYSGDLPDAAIEAWFADPLALMLGEPDTPRFLRMIHYDMQQTGTPIPVGWSTQIADLHPMSIEQLLRYGLLDAASLTPASLELFFETMIVPLLAEGLAQYQEGFHGRRVKVQGKPDHIANVRTSRVWAFHAPAHAQLMKARYFPNATVSGGHISMTRHQDAAAAVVAMRPH